MHYTATMSPSFESEKNQKAFLYTTAVVIALLLIFIFWKWSLPFTPAPVAEDKIEINLGNFDEGMGTVQPLIKGEKAPGEEHTSNQKQTAAAPAKSSADEVQPEEDNKEEDAAPVVKPEKIVPKTPVVKQPVMQPVKTPAPVIVPEPKPQKPKIAGYGVPKNGTGNGADETNDHRMQGNKPGGKGDAGDNNGKPDSYGNNPGGRTGGGGLRVSKGDRTIVNNYIFMGELPKATINAIIKVSPEGRGSFVGFDKGSTSSDGGYATAIRGYLPNIQFSKADHESVVTVPFNFKVQ